MKADLYMDDKIAETHGMRNDASEICRTSRPASDMVNIGITEIKMMISAIMRFEYD